MKLFAHRGWSTGSEENTINAFRKSVELGVDGVEFDVRFGGDGQTVVVSHDPVGGAPVLSLDEVLGYLKETNLELLIELKEHNEVFYSLVVEHLIRHDLVQRATIFAFPRIAHEFPWANRENIKLGIIAPYPTYIKKFIEQYNPDMVLMGWGDTKERFLFKLAWNVLSLKKIFAKYSPIRFVVGVAYSGKDKSWLARQTGIYGITADLPLR